MSASLSPTKLLICPGCRAGLPAENLRPGQKCRCGKCGKLIVVPRAKTKRPQSAKPRSFGFSCRVCETRLVALTTTVGKKIRCPDCGVKNEIPPPPQPKPKQTPQAMFGQQYGVWDVDEAPSSAELQARQPKFFPVYCRVCDTLMYGQEKQVGRPLTCPDCSAKTMVPPPPVVQPKASVLVPDGEEYQLEEPELDLEVFDTPEPTPEPEESPTKSVREQLKEEYGERPEPPRIPLLQGVGKMFVRSPLPGWWLSLSFMAGVVAIILGGATGGISSEFGALFAVSCVAGVSILGFLAFLGFATLCLAIVTDSAEGNDKLYSAPDFNVGDWFGGGIYLGIALAVSCIPGAVVGAYVGYQAQSALVGSFFFFPVLLLSMLELGTPMGLVSPRIVGSLVRRPLHWLLFYLITGAMTAVTLLGLSALPDNAVVLALVIPVLLGMDLLYFHLLGRLGWWLSESIPAAEPAESE